MTAFPILLVDDDALDVKMTKEAFAKAMVSNPLYVVGDGGQALAYLRQEGPHGATDGAPRALAPGLILLDLNMPRVNGLEFLSQRRADQALASIPTVVMTTSAAQGDRLQAYRLGVAGYIIKSMDFDRYVEACAVLHRYWSLCALP